MTNFQTETIAFLRKQKQSYSLNHLDKFVDDYQNEVEMVWILQECKV